MVVLGILVCFCLFGWGTPRVLRDHSWQGFGGHVGARRVPHLLSHHSSPEAVTLVGSRICQLFPSLVLEFPSSGNRLFQPKVNFFFFSLHVFHYHHYYQDTVIYSTVNSSVAGVQRHRTTLIRVPPLLAPLTPLHL